MKLNKITKKTGIAEQKLSQWFETRRIIMSTIEYEAIVHHCIKTGELWEDPEFPAVQSSVFYHQTPPFSFQWKRPHVSTFYVK